MFDAPGQQDQRAIDIAPTARPTGTHVPAFSQWLFDHRSARMTALRGFQGARRSLSIDDTSFCRFVSQDAEELRWSTIQNGFVESSLSCRPIWKMLSGRLILLGLGTTCHVGRLKLLREECRRPVNHRCRLLVVEIEALPSDLAVYLHHTLVRQTPPRRELCLGVSGAVCGCELLFALPQKARVGNRYRLTLRTGNGGKRLDTQSNAMVSTPRARSG